MKRDSLLLQSHTDGRTMRANEDRVIVAASDQRVKLVRFRRNFGQTAAMAAGMQHSKGRVIIPLDADLQNDPNDIPRLLAKMDEGYDVVSGWRKKRKDDSIRRIPSRIANRLISRVTGAAQAQQMRLRFAYDALGRLTQAINADATVSMTYDALGQLVAEQTDAAGASVLLRHVYDELGNRVQTTLPDGRVLNNLYYGSGHLHQVNLDGEVITDIERALETVQQGKRVLKGNLAEKIEHRAWLTRFQVAGLTP